MFFAVWHFLDLPGSSQHSSPASCWVGQQKGAPYMGMWVIIHLRHSQHLPSWFISKTCQLNVNTGSSATSSSSPGSLQCWRKCQQASGLPSSWPTTPWPGAAPRSSSSQNLKPVSLPLPLWFPRTADLPPARSYQCSGAVHSCRR